MPAAKARPGQQPPAQPPQPPSAQLPDDDPFVAEEAAEAGSANGGLPLVDPEAAPPTPSAWGRPGLARSPEAAQAQPQGADLASRMQGLISQAGAASVPTDRQAEAAVMGLLGKTDLSQISSQQFRILPIDQEYEAELKKVTATRAKQSGNPMVAIEMEVVYPEAYAGVKLFDQCVLVDSSLWKLKSLLEATGLLGEDGTFSGSSIQELVGYAVRFSVRHDEYQGTTRNKVAGGYSEAYEAPGLVPSEVAAGEASPFAG